MKKIIAVILCLVLSASLLLCGCTDKEEAAETTKSRTNIGSALKQEPIAGGEEDTHQEEEPTPAPVKNEFFNDSNSFYDVNNLSIRPRHVYWEGDKLIAECFVTNGQDTMAYNINVKKLAFSNEQGPIADAVFGTIDGLTVPAYGYTIWTFSFGGEAVLNAGADLSSLHYESSVSYSH